MYVPGLLAAVLLIWSLHVILISKMTPRFIHPMALQPISGLGLLYFQPPFSEASFEVL
jgi:hypothetical protein